MSESLDQVIINFLDRMIDESVKSAETLSAIKTMVMEQKGDVDKILEHFHNGFKSELKEHTEEEVEKLESLIKQVRAKMETDDEKKKRIALYKRIDKLIDRLYSPKTWFSLVVSLIVAVSVIIGSIAGITEFLRRDDRSMPNNSMVEDNGSIPGEEIQQEPLN